MKKKTFHKDQEHSDIVDIFAQSLEPKGMDLIVEVKTWDRPVSGEVVSKFIQLKERLTPGLERKTGFLLYSEQGFTPEKEQLMRRHGIMYTSFATLVGKL